MRSYQLRIRSRAGAIALGIAVVVIGIVVIVSGIALLVGVAAVAILLAGTAMVLRKVFGRRPANPVRPAGTLGFDPALEVFPPDPRDPRPQLGDASRPEGTEGGNRIH